MNFFYVNHPEWSEKKLVCKNSRNKSGGIKCERKRCNRADELCLEHRFFPDVDHRMKIGSDMREARVEWTEFS